ncbi:MAG: hypothetical protein BHW08_01305 [Clostridium sp. CAG:12237_41]|nr:MAG: hypothetical protein BHW08_01305 [Clostridium sp. CAG:12237_41]
MIIHVKDYGKIKEAKIKLAPLTLFVGDNNSGKSYLTSLIWGLYNIGTRRLFGEVGRLETRAEKQLKKWLDEQIDIAIEKGDSTVSLNTISSTLYEVINDCLERKKDKLVSWIFNSPSVKIGELKIQKEEFENTKQLKCKFLCEKNEEIDSIEIRCGNKGFITSLNEKKSYRNFLLNGIISAVLDIPFNNSLSINSLKNANIYVPAARTGFMLTKDIVNKVGRDNTFNMQSEIEDEIQITPFTKPINQFIDEICGLNTEHEQSIKTKELADMIEKEMTYGSVDISNLPGKEIRYYPEGLSESKPLRVASAVVTELSPLILLFKHRPNIESVFYEEPEMGLHPQLQQKMGKILVETINSGIRIVSTTHSDIILQHINNMIKLKRHKQCKEICDKLGYTDKDLLDETQVKVYQLTNEDPHNTLVEELYCSEYGFEIPTFNDALDRIMNENYEIQE